jgi:hypothetical protein
MSGLQLLKKTDPSAYIAILSEIGSSISNSAVGASAGGNAAAASIVAELEADLSDANAAMQPAQATQPSST